METSVEEMINPFVYLRRNSESDPMPEDTHISINKRRLYISVCVFVWKLRYSKLLYRLTDSPLYRLQKKYDTA